MSNWFVNAKYAVLTCGRPRGDVVAIAHSVEASRSRRAARAIRSELTGRVERRIAIDTPSSVQEHRLAVDVTDLRPVRLRVVQRGDVDAFDALAHHVDGEVHVVAVAERDQASVLASRDEICRHH